MTWGGWDHAPLSIYILDVIGVLYELVFCLVSVKGMTALHLR